MSVTEREQKVFLFCLWDLRDLKGLIMLVLKENRSSQGCGHKGPNEVPLFSSITYMCADRTTPLLQLLTGMIFSLNSGKHFFF